MFSNPVVSKLLVESTRIRHLYVSRVWVHTFFFVFGDISYQFLCSCRQVH
jgi:hypothetical protein